MTSLLYGRKIKYVPVTRTSPLVYHKRMIDTKYYGKNGALNQWHQCSRKKNQRHDIVTSSCLAGATKLVNNSNWNWKVEHILNLWREGELLGWSGFRSTVNWWATKRPFWSRVPNTALESPKFPTIRSWPWYTEGKLNCQLMELKSKTDQFFCKKQLPAWLK